MFDYDAAGNQTAMSGFAMTYDGENRLLQAEVAEALRELAGGPGNLRVPHS